MRPGLIIFSTLPMLSGVALAAAPAADGEDHGNSGGLPQLEFDTYPSQVFWLVITFLILYFLCAKVFLPRLGGLMGWMKRHMEQIERIMGLLLWTVGLLMLTGGFSRFSYWLLETFPALATLG